MDRVKKTTYPDQEEVNSAYNGQLLLDSMASTTTYLSTGTRYNALGQPTTLNYGNNDTVTMTYDSATSRLTSISAPSVSLSYLYFNNGNISRITDGTATNFTYDALDRLKTASGEYSASYDYDQIGNITSKTEGSNTQSYSYTGTSHKHAPVSATLNGGSADNYSYDANGNLTSRSGLTLKYDAENRLSTGAQENTTGELSQRYPPGRPT